ncbi:branched-chain amino acid abc transporter, permease protein [Heliomicrobium modesticaldum Ice1]|uniref:Branched-chain amino acid abc transporter, permease protein n=1 Tax=Heliobacterium modesticaldum (strain ATCC 51547 / Ice1) TaxID=498761 RepID=B0TAM7_HELMI|nr:branched-chain amino acid ABC transporter permease [Heliomicrobium modesticaldum]ABZ83679.1 branched-chain amino acid abc transporter, permease protein [Heliomicrobium modesticaldum Ice1]
MEESVLIFAGVNIILAVSLYITLSTGQISLGHGAFMAIGAYVASVMTVNFGVHLYIAMMGAAIASGLVGIAVGFPALRVKGIYLAIGTLGLCEVVEVFFHKFEYTGAASGFSGMSGTTVPLVWAVAALCILFCWQLSRSRMGWAFKAVKEDEVAAQTMGLNITYLKVSAFGMSAAMAGLGGALYAHYIFFIDPAAFGYHTSLLILFYVIFGGAETFWGAALGALILTVLPTFIRGLEEWRFTVYGLLIMAMMAIRPQGLISPETILWLKKSFSRSDSAKGASLVLSHTGSASAAPPVSSETSKTASNKPEGGCGHADR